jgi:hypothetical protein
MPTERGLAGANGRDSTELSCVRFDDGPHFLEHAFRAEPHPEVRPRHWQRKLRRLFGNTLFLTLHVLQVLIVALLISN